MAADAEAISRCRKFLAKKRRTHRLPLITLFLLNFPAFGDELGATGGAGRGKAIS